MTEDRHCNTVNRCRREFESPVEFLTAVMLVNHQREAKE